MGKTITNNKLSISEIDNLVPLEKGGTETTTLSGAIANLGIISNSSKNKPDGVAGLNSSGKITSPIESGLLVGDNIVLSGPTSSPISTDIEYTIVGYSSFKQYSIYLDKGHFIHADNKIKIRTPDTTGTIKLTVNGVTRNISITSDTTVIERPTIAYPVSGSNGYSGIVTAITNGLSIIGASTAHVSSTWEISTSPTFEPNVTVSNNGTGSALRTYVFKGLNSNTLYYIRVRFNGTGTIKSSWSETCEFTTRTDKDFNYQEDTYLDPYSKSSNGRYGSNVFISENGNTVVVSEYNATIEGSSNTGKVYLFVRNNNRWQLIQTFIEPEDVSTRFFGYSISMSRNHTFLAISAVADPIRNPNELGKVYIYNNGDGISNSTFRLGKVINPIDREAGDMFGYHVSMVNMWLAIGAPKATVNGLTDAGLIHVYKRNTSDGTAAAFEPISTYSPIDKRAGDGFGTRVVICTDESRLIVSSPYATISNRSKQGCVYVYNKVNNSTEYSYRATLVPSDGAGGDNFGSSIDIDDKGGYIVVGSKNATRGGTKIGQAYVYELTDVGNNTWTQIDMLKSSILSICVDFGYSVAMSGDGVVIAIGSIMTNRPNMVNAGIVQTYIKKGGKWEYNDMLLASDETIEDHFGESIDITYNGSEIVIGASNAIRYGQKVGTVYTFRGLN